MAVVVGVALELALGVEERLRGAEGVTLGLFVPEGRVVAEALALAQEVTLGESV